MPDPSTGVDWSTIGQGGGFAAVFALLAWFLRQALQRIEEIPKAIRDLASANNETASKVAAEHRTEVLALQAEHRAEVEGLLTRLDTLTDRLLGAVQQPPKKVIPK